jgi:hypothetical protein
LGPCFLAAAADQPILPPTPQTPEPPPQPPPPPPPPLPLTMARASGGGAPTSRALCIGVNAYEHTEALQPLKGCIHDAEDVGAVLAAHGFEVRILRDPSGLQLHDAIETLVGECRDGDKVLVLLAGHGGQWENDNYLFPVDFGTATRGVVLDLPKDALAVHAGIVMRLEQKNPSGLSVVIADMCRSSTRFRHQEATRAAVSSQFAKPEIHGSGALVAFACEQGNSSLDTGRNGVYTSTLLKYLARPMHIEDMLGVVGTEVKRKTATSSNPMRPWNSGSLDRVVNPATEQPFSILLIESAPQGTMGGGGGASAMSVQQFTPSTELPNARMTPAQVVELIRTGAKDARVAEEGAKALVALTGGEGMKADRAAALKAAGVDYESRCAELVGLGSVALLVSVLMRQSAAIVVHALKALRNIAGVDAGSAVCAALGAVPAIVSCLKIHAGVADVAHYGCWALVKIAAIQSGKVACVSSGAVPAILSCLKTLAGEADVAHFGCSALASIAGIESGQEACVSAGAVPAILSCLTTHAGVTDVAYSGCRALIGIAAIQSGQEACVSAGAVPVILSCLKTHAGAADVAHYGFWALANIAVIQSGQEACVSAGAVPSILSCLKTHAGAADVAQYGCHALLNIGWSIASHQAAIVAAGAIPLLAVAFSRHTGVARQNAHEALNNLGYTDQGAKK